MRYLMILAPILLAASPAFGGNKTDGNRKACDLGTLKAATSLTSAVAFTIPESQSCNLMGYDLLVLTMHFTHANNGALTTTCTVSDDAGVTDAAPTTCATASGTCTLSFAGVFVTPSLTADKDYVIRADIGGYRHIECSTAHGGAPAAGDTLSVTGYLTVR